VVADDLLDQPMHAQPLLGRLEQPVAAQRDDCLVERERVAGQLG